MPTLFYYSVNSKFYILTCILVLFVVSDLFNFAIIFILSNLMYESINRTLRKKHKSNLYELLQTQKPIKYLMISN